MRRAPLWLAVVVALVVSAGSLLADNPPVVVAQQPGGGIGGTVVGPAAPAAPVVGATNAPLGMGLTVIGVGLGLGLIGFAALGGIARQPEQAGNIRTTMLIIGGLVEGAGIIGLVLCLVAKN